VRAPPPARRKIPFFDDDDLDRLHREMADTKAARDAVQFNDETGASRM
jgi:hypothetical protein